MGRLYAAGGDRRRGGRRAVSRAASAPPPKPAKPPRVWQRMLSGRRLDLLDPSPFDVEIAEAVADKLGVEVSFQETQWDAIFAGLEAGRFDVIANQVSINPEREEKYLFSAPYSVATSTPRTRLDRRRG